MRSKIILPTLGITTLLLLTHSPTAFGNEKGIKITQQGEQIFLEAKICEDLKTELAALQKWTETRGEKTPQLTVDCNQTPGLNKIEITNQVPRFVAQAHGKEPKCHGPNCWNNALVERKFLPKQRITGDDEYDYYLSHFCEEKLTWEKAPGDLIAIKKRTPSGGSEHVHGFTYIGETVCSKNGLASSSSCQIQPFENVLSLYNVDQDPRCRGSSLGIPKSCTIYMSFYRCTPPPLSNDPKVLETEELFSSCAISGQFPVSLKGLSEHLEVLKQYLGHNSINAQKEAVTLSSLKIQLDLFREHAFEQAVKNKDTKQITEILAGWKDVNRSPFLLPIQIAAENGDARTIVTLLDLGARTDLVKSNGETIFMIAAQNGHLGVLETLEDWGIDTTVANKNGKTALMSAAKSGRNDVIQFLLKQGSPVNQKDKLEGTALIYAAQNGHLDTTKLLVEKKASVNFKTTRGLTALFMACQNGHTEVVRYLLSKKAELNNKKDGSATPLIMAAQEGHTQIVELLLHEKADKEIQAIDGKTALAAAVWYGHYAVVELLLKAGAKTSPHLNNGMSILELANNPAKPNSKQLYDLLKSHGA